MTTRIFDPCRDCALARTCTDKCATRLDWERRGYWEDYMPETDEDYDEREEAFTPQERNPGWRNW